MLRPIPLFLLLTGISTVTGFWLQLRETDRLHQVELEKVKREYEGALTRTKESSEGESKTLIEQNQYLDDQKKALETELDTLKAGLQAMRAREAESKLTPEVVNPAHEKAAEEIRGLSWKSPITYQALPVESYRLAFGGTLFGQLKPEDFERLGRAWKCLGLIPDVPEEGIEASISAAMSMQLGGAWNAERQELQILQGEEKLRTSTQSSRRVQDLTLRLLEQNFPIASSSPEEGQSEIVPRNTDKILAGHAARYGDANLVSVFQKLQDSALKGPDSDGTEINVRPPMDGESPIGVKELVRFPFASGLTFAQSLFDQGGWEALNAAHLNPPTTSREILHPEEYLSKKTPESVSLFWNGEVPEDFSPLWDDVLGEFGIRLMLRFYVPEQTAVIAAKGWQGDRFRVYETPEGEVLLWQTVWETEEDAQEFKKEIWDALQFRFQIPSSEESGSIKKGGNSKAHVLLNQNFDGKGVLVCLAPHEQVSQKLNLESGENASTYFTIDTE